MSPDGVYHPDNQQPLKDDPLRDFVNLLVFIEVKWTPEELAKCGLPEEKLRQIIALMREKVVEDGLPVCE